MGPAQQRFDADNAAALGGDDRLIVHVEGLVVDGGFEFAAEETPLGMLLVDFGTKRRTAPRPLRLAARNARTA